MVNPQNIVRFDARIRSQRKLLLICIFLSMGIDIFLFIMQNIALIFSLVITHIDTDKTVDGAINKLTKIFNEAIISIIIDALMLYFVVKLNRLGILVFGWITVIYIILEVLSMIFFIILLSKHLIVLTQEYSHSESTTLNGIDIVMMIGYGTLLIITISKIIFIFKLEKSLKERNKHDIQQSFPLV
ncbi:hypothetical protein I4U23_027654 [Adineta vaga]|nr:hypothetical protein I4U23_027654 [Adineta vaga]